MIFLHRRGSLEPFMRHFAHTNFLELLTTENGSVQGRTTIIFILLQPNSVVSNVPPQVCFSNDKMHLYVQEQWPAIFL